MLDAATYPTLEAALESFRRYLRNKSVIDGCVRSFDGAVVADFEDVKRYLAKHGSRAYGG